MGWDNVFHCEINPFCQKVLKKNFPSVIQHGDIKQFDGTQYRGAIDIISGGFPCQPYSSAGKRKGKEDTRHLWPEMLRIIREIQPSYVVGENVRGLLSWSGGMVFDEVQADLEAEGFTVLPFLLPACGVDAPHRRDRIWFIAYSNSNAGRLDRHGEGRRQASYCQTEVWEQWIRDELTGNDATRIAANTKQIGLQNRDGKSLWLNSLDAVKRHNLIPEWSAFPSAEPGICRGDDGIPNRMDRLKALGNAIVPQVAFEIFRAIEQAHEHHAT
jgi:DNA (cytosine-5)-methyltransferase 1